MSALHNTVTQLFVHVRARECLHANLVSAGLNSADVETLSCNISSLGRPFPPWTSSCVILSSYLCGSTFIIHAPSCFDVSVLSSCSSEEPGDGRRRRQDVPGVHFGVKHAPLD